MSAIRQEVMAELIASMAKAEADGLDAMKAAALAFPGTPTSVLAKASVEVDQRQVEAWWQTLEKTIDGEMIRNALASPRTRP